MIELCCICMSEMRMQITVFKEELGGVKGVGKCKLIKLERNLCVPNYVELFTIFLAAFCHILIVALTLLLFVNFPRVGQLRAADIVVLISFPLP